MRLKPDASSLSADLAKPDLFVHDSEILSYGLSIPARHVSSACLSDAI